MGIHVYLVRYERTNIPRNYEFHDLLRTNFSNDEGSVIIDTDSWKDFIDDWKATALLPESDGKYKEEIEEIEKLLKENDNTIELSFG